MTWIKAFWHTRPLRWHTHRSSWLQRARSLRALTRLVREAQKLGLYE